MIELKSKTPRALARFVVSGVFLSMMCLGLFFGCRRRPQLPPVRAYSALPASFNQTLLSLYAQANARPGDLEVVRKLAHLYQANHLFAEARVCYGALAVRKPGLTAQDHYYLAEMAQADGDLDR